MAEVLKNAGQRSRGFREVLELMVAGRSTREVLKPWQPILDDARPEDLVMVVDTAVAEGIDFELLKPAVSRLINLMHSSLIRHRYVAPPNQPFFSSLMAENKGLLSVLEQGKAATKALNSSEPETIAWGLKDLADLASRLAAIEIHFRKKENVLFPWFEARYPQFRCVRLMWEIHDDARKGLKSLSGLLKKTRTEPAIDPRPINAVVGKLYFDLNTNLFREECALFPVMAPLISDTEGRSLFIEAHEYGYAFLEETEEAAYKVEAARSPTAPDLRGPQAAAPDQIPLSGPNSGPFRVSGSPASYFTGRTGFLPPEILAALFSTIHLDMTWVDADDKVRWFSDSPKRIFPRSPSIIGRDVRNCHPGASVGRVVSILEDFKAGRKDREAFWLTMKGRFIHIEYFALRGPGGEYLGTLEASEDLTEKRGLQGEKRLAE